MHFFCIFGLNCGLSIFLHFKNEIILPAVGLISYTIESMSRLQIQLHRNLRRTILRGHPWIYKDAVVPPAKIQRAQLCQVIDGKNEPVAWAYYDPHSPLCLRVLSLEKKPPTFETYESRFALALKLRKSVISKSTDSYRLFNGEGDHLPGLICDVYNQISASVRWPRL